MRVEVECKDTLGRTLTAYVIYIGHKSNRLTSLGLNNYGKQVYRYGLEDTDVDENGQEIFRESDSRFFCRIRDLFSNELKTMYNTLESKNAWHAESFLNKADEWQSQFPEELWRLDIARKYIRTYNSSFINGKGDDTFLTTMSNGKMKYHRRQWERNQEKYMASKYQSSNASSDTESIVIRCASIPSDSADDMVVQPNYTLTLTPYAYMYLNVQYGDNASPISQRVVPNVAYEIPFTGTSVDGIKIYSSSMLQSIGDLSSCYATVIRAQNASKLKTLDVGNSTDGYDNPYLNELGIGSNYLLEKLNMENVSGYTGSLNLSVLNNLKEVYAHGTNVGGVTFADGGRIEIAELPAITSMTMKNLIYLTTLDITSFDKLTTLTVENCDTVDLITILESATNVERVRIVGVDWTLDDTSLLERLYEMKGIDRSGYNVDQSALTGTVHVPVIKQQQLADYQAAWPDLEIVASTIMEQFPVTFVNDDGTVLDVQYVVAGEDAVDPVTRKDNPIPTPTKESTVSTDYTYAGWDSVLTTVHSARTITATYTESTREYTVKYISKGTTLQETTAPYGENVLYEGITPTYTLEEDGYKFYLFNRWDKSGIVDGDKTINAIFDEFKYSEGVFDGKQLNDLDPVEIYAITQLGVDYTGVDIQDGDEFSFDIGYDVNFDDIESKVIFSGKKSFDGTNYVDTGIKLFDVDKDFTLAIDYKMLGDSAANSALVQCYQSNGSRGFRLGYNNGVKVSWGSKSGTASSVGNREMLIIRHKKGDNSLTVYNSNLSSDEPQVITFDGSETIIDSTLVFGCVKEDDGAYERFAVGDVYWCKLWYMDLGDSACQELAGWTHESMTMEVCSFKQYYLTDNASKRCTFTLLATHLMDRSRQLNQTYQPACSWADARLNTFLNSRLYNAMPTQIKLLLKKVNIKSSAGNGSEEITESGCYIAIPSMIELHGNGSYSFEPYINEGTPISYIVSDDDRKRTKLSGDGEAESYWTRSPHVKNYDGDTTAYRNYMYYIDDNGAAQGWSSATNEYGVLIMISF